ncbi:protein-disulfide reductase DsbD domain-containing protein [Microvirga rosea]|uniref:protein-disulfide reductase DsbD domain-containing protein n=1 Tax=Microvirga rosea TaxID=2715425 RepID=UPI001D0A4693|nr:protein-disulfide reductase DsbD domain-containing protein [Microvirga rosea]MCB8820354.1 hypothetical protein [Microvirga rosea]
MALRLSSILAVISFILALFPVVGQAQAPSPSWVQGLHSRVSLLSAGPRGDDWLSGIAISLDPGFKTYWRTPGDSGLPPRFDWSGSSNVAAVEVKWPAPTRHEDAAGVAYIYHDAVVLPVIVKPADATKPVVLALSIDYGVCKDICIPAHADLKLPLKQDPVQQEILDKALAREPRPQPIGATTPLSILSVEPQSEGKLGLRVRARAPEGLRPDLFAEGPENWYFSTSPAGPDGSFVVSIEEKPKDMTGPVPLRLTLTAGDQAVETEVKLDGNGRPQ